MRSSDALSYRKAAKLIGVHAATLHRWRNKGILPVPVRTYAPTGQYVMTPADVRVLKAWVGDPLVLSREPDSVAA